LPSLKCHIAADMFPTYRLRIGQMGAQTAISWGSKPDMLLGRTSVETALKKPICACRVTRHRD